MNEFNNLVRKLTELGPPRHRPSSGETWNANLGSCACDKKVAVTNFRVFSTGLIPVVDNVCPGCRGAAAGLAIIVCPRCRAVVARIQPHQDLSGFSFLANKSYHLDCCAVCEPEIIVQQGEPTFILEMLSFMKAQGKPIPDQWRNRLYKKPLLLGATSA